MREMAMDMPSLPCNVRDKQTGLAKSSYARPRRITQEIVAQGPKSPPEPLKPRCTRNGAEGSKGCPVKILWQVAAVGTQAVLRQAGVWRRHPQGMQ
jgi:hypothetical protein